MGCRIPSVMVYCSGGGGKYVGRWLPDEKGPGAVVAQRPGGGRPGLASPPAVELRSGDPRLGERFLWSPRTGELGLLPYGDPGKEDPTVGVRVNKKSFADSCQKTLLDVNISDQPVGVFSSGSSPTDESSDMINPIRSSFCIKFRPRNTPSLLIFIRQSPFGFAVSGTSFEASV